MLNRFLILLFVIILFKSNDLSGLSNDDIDSLKSVDYYQSVSDHDKYYLYCHLADISINTDTIIYYSRKARAIAEKNNLNPAQSYVLSGSGYLQSGYPVIALEFFTKAAEYYKESDNKTGLATVYNYIASIYSIQQNFRNFKIYINQAIDLFEEENDSGRLANALQNLGYSYYKENEFDSALIFFEKAKQIYKLINYQTGYAYCIGNTGLVLSKKHNLEEAENLLLKSINILEQYNDDYAIAEFTIEYAYVLQRKKYTTKALEQASFGYQIARQNNIIESVRDAAYRLSDIYKEINRFDSAFFYQSLYITISDSIKNIKSVQRIADIRTEFEIEQKQNEVDILKRKRYTQLFIICSLALILLLAGGLIYVYYKSLTRARKFNLVIEERHKLLERQSNELKELNRIKDKFFSIISHDLRGPISSIGGISILIKESMASDNKALLREITDYIDQTVVSLTGLLENLLNWAQSQQESLNINVEYIEADNLIKQIVKLFSTVALSKNIKIKLDIKGSPVIYGDKNSLMMILRNLLSNAIKFTDSGGEVHISCSKTEKGFIKLIIEDTGIGIQEDKLKTIFDLWIDKSTWGTDKEKGFGLGLNLVNEFVKLNNGKIDVKSNVGEGTTFIILLPSN